MKKATERRIPYRVYKKLFSDCQSWDYDAKSASIMVRFPQDYLDSKRYCPDGWTSACNHVDLAMDDRLLHCTIIESSDGGCISYTAYVTRGNPFHPLSSRKSLGNIRSFPAAVEWCLSTKLAW